MQVVAAPSLVRLMAEVEQQGKSRASLLANRGDPLAQQLLQWLAELAPRTVSVADVAAWRARQAPGNHDSDRCAVGGGLPRQCRRSVLQPAGDHDRRVRAARVKPGRPRRWRAREIASSSLHEMVASRRPNRPAPVDVARWHAQSNDAAGSIGTQLPRRRGTARSAAALFRKVALLIG